MAKSYFILPLIMSLFALTASVQSQQPAKPGYDALVEKVKSGDATVDFKELRISYADSQKYSPYGVGGENRKAMFAALDDKNYKNAIKHAESILKENYVDINAHMVSYIAHRELKNSERADYHQRIARGLIDSILQSGDGKSTEKAFVVVSTDEEYVILKVLGLRPSSQSLIHLDGHSYDKLDGVNPETKETVSLYFNIDKPLG